MRTLAGKGRARRLIVGLLLAMLIIGALPMGAFAARPTKKSTTDLDQNRVVRYEVTTFDTPVKGSSDKDISIAGSGSRIKTTSVAGYNALGMMLWKFSYRVEWSWTDGVITSVKGSSWPDVYAVGWEYLGLTDNTGYYINNNTGYYARRGAHFALGSGGYYIQHAYPWIEYRVYAGGNYTVSTSGD